VGYAASHDRVAARFESIGIRSFSPEAALESLGHIIDGAPAQVSVLGIDWPTFLDRSPTCASSPRFSGVASLSRGGTGADAAHTEVSSLRRALGALQSVEAALRDQIAKVVGSAAAKLDVQTTLTDLGFDSLMAVELRNWAESNLGVHVRTMEIMRGPTIRQLAERLLASFRNGLSPKA
jgi:aryl carrier-like protein